MTTEQVILEYLRAAFPYPHRQIIDERNPNMIILALDPDRKRATFGYRWIRPWELFEDLIPILEINLDTGEM